MLFTDEVEAILSGGMAGHRASPLRKFVDQFVRRVFLQEMKDIIRRSVLVLLLHVIITLLSDPPPPPPPPLPSSLNI